MGEARFTTIAKDVGFPEGPVWCTNGDVYIVDIRHGTIVAISPDGSKRDLAYCGGGPNGMAVGPDGMLYVCNNGGFEWGGAIPGGAAADYTSGSIQRVDPKTGTVETLFVACGDVPLRGPNDIVFDKDGGFWFTDLGKMIGRVRDMGALYYAKCDGSTIVEAAFPLDGPNGVGLSPDGSRLYIGETHSGRLYYWDVESPGVLRKASKFGSGGTYLATAINGLALDSLAVDSLGNICAAAPGKGGGLIVFSPIGEQRFVATGDPITTNICFGGEDLGTAYLTLSRTSQVVSMPWDNPGLKLAFNL